jgi:hypothetical protein
VNFDGTEFYIACAVLIALVVIFDDDDNNGNYA